MPAHDGPREAFMTKTRKHSLLGSGKTAQLEECYPADMKNRVQNSELMLKINAMY